MSTAESPVTQLLAEWSARGEGSDAALAQLAALLYDELRRLAQGHLRRERQDHTLQRTALVNEAFLRLVDQRAADWNSRAQFLALASTVMRRILVDHARTRGAGKRGGGAERVSLDALAARTDEDGRLLDDVPTALQHRDGELHEDVVAIDRALAQLAGFDAQQAKVVEMRYFAGLTIEETADALGISPATVKREWAMARAWLRRAIERER